MPITYVNLASTTLGASQNTVTFSSIPQTYTDLVLRLSTRKNNTSPFLSIYFNGNNTNYSVTSVYGDGSTAGTIRFSSTTDISVYSDNGSDTTANTFSNGELYIPNYTASVNKPVYYFGASETNAASGPYVGAAAGLWRNTSAITSVSVYINGSPQYVAGSTFYLYGIKNS